MRAACARFLLIVARNFLKRFSSFFFLAALLLDLVAIPITAGLLGDGVVGLLSELALEDLEALVLEALEALEALELEAVEALDLAALVALELEELELEAVEALDLVALLEPFLLNVFAGEALGETAAAGAAFITCLFSSFSTVFITSACTFEFALLGFTLAGGDIALGEAASSFFAAIFALSRALSAALLAALFPGGAFNDAGGAFIGLVAAFMSLF